MVMTRTPKQAEKLYTIAELAELWGVSRDTIERLLKRGELESVMVGQRRRISASAAQAYVDAHA